MGDCPRWCVRRESSGEGWSRSSAVLLPSDWLSVSLTGGDISTSECGEGLCAGTRTVPLPRCSEGIRLAAPAAAAGAGFAVILGLPREAGFAGEAPIMPIFLAKSPSVPDDAAVDAAVAPWLHLRAEDAAGVLLCCAVGGDAFSLVRLACLGVQSACCLKPCLRSFGVGGAIPSSIAMPPTAARATLGAPGRAVLAEHPVVVVPTGWAALGRAPPRPRPRPRPRRRR